MRGPGSSPATPTPIWALLRTGCWRQLPIGEAAGTALGALPCAHSIWTHVSCKCLSFVPLPAHTWVPRHPVSLFSQPLGMRMGFVHPQYPGTRKKASKDKGGRGDFDRPTATPGSAGPSPTDQHPPPSEPSVGGAGSSSGYLCPGKAPHSARRLHPPGPRRQW